MLNDGQMKKHKQLFRKSQRIAAKDRRIRNHEQRTKQTWVQICGTYYLLLLHAGSGFSKDHFIICFCHDEIRKPFKSNMIGNFISFKEQMDPKQTLYKERNNQ